MGKEILGGMDERIKQGRKGNSKEVNMDAETERRKSESRKETEEVRKEIKMQQRESKKAQEELLR